MSDDKNQAALAMANEELDLPVESKAEEDGLDSNSKYGDGTNLTSPKDEDDDENEDDQEDLDEDQEGEEDDEDEENANAGKSNDNSEEDEEDAVEDINISQN
jgi:hypothetical protein